MEARLRSSSEQYSTIVEFMEKYGDISRPQPGAQGRLRAEELWRELANILNSIGGGVQRTPDKWKKVWVDWKSKTKKKAMVMRRHASGTGGGPRHSVSLSRLEERVLAILGPLAVGGQDSIQEIGLPHANSNQIEVSQQDEQLSESVGSSTQSSVEILVVGSSEGQEHMSVPPLGSPLRPPSASNVSSANPLEVDPTQDLPASTSAPRESSRTVERERPSSPRRRTRRNLTPFERASQSFVHIEEQRLRFEERREENLHIRETQRLQLESERISIQRQTNETLARLTEIAGEVLAFLRTRNA